MAIAAVDHGKIEFGAALAANLKGMIDIVGNQNLGAAFFQRFGDGLFEIGVMGEQESEVDIHIVFQG